MTRPDPFVLATPQGRRLEGLLDLPQLPGARPAVVVCHGFKGFMEWGFFPHLAQLLADRGFVVVRFNFSGSGMKPGEDLATDLEGFRGNTFSADLEDLLAVLGAVTDGTLAAGRVEASRVAVLGHSRGGGTALLAAAHHSWRDRIQALVTWAAVSTFDRYDDGEKTAWREQGEVTIVNGRTGQRLPMGVAALDDLERHRGALDLEAAAARRCAPWLILHGAEDESVPAREAAALHRAAAAPVELAMVAGGNHTFGSRHPFAGPTPALIEVMNRTQAWLRRHL